MASLSLMEVYRKMKNKTFENIKIVKKECEVRKESREPGIRKMIGLTNNHSLEKVVKSFKRFGYESSFSAVLGLIHNAHQAKKS